MAEVSKLPEDGESVGVNQIRNKVNEIIEEGVGGGGGSVIDVGDVGEYSSNLANELLVSPPIGSNSNEGLRNTHPTYIPNGATEKLTDFPVHQKRITDETAINMFAILLNGKLYIATGNDTHGVSLGSGSNSAVRPGLENMREFHMGGYYQDKPDVKVLDFHLSFTYCAVLMSDGILWGWGNNSRGQLGQGNTTTYNNPIIIDRNVTRMWGPKGVKQYQTSWNDHDVLYWENSTDPFHTLRCAGYNGQGQLGDETTITTGTAAKPYVLTSYNHLHDYGSYRIKQVYNFSGVYGFIFIVLQHRTDARVQQVIACGYNGYGNLGIDRMDSHTTFGPSEHSSNANFDIIHPSNTVNVTKWLWCKDARNHPSWTPTWQCYFDSCSIEIMGFYGGFHHGSTASTGSIHPWAYCWSRVWSGYGQTQGDFLRSAGSNNWGMLGALDPGFGRTSIKNSNYKTYKYITHKSGGYTFDEALADAPNQLTGAKLAAPMSRADWNRLSMNIVENFSKPGASDLHHAWLGLTDEEGEGWWKNYHTNRQADRLYIPFARPQADDSGTSRFLQGQGEYVYYDPNSQALRSEDITEFRYTGSGETDGIRADNYFNNSGNAAGRGVHDMISVGRGETTTNNYTFIAETYCSSTTNGTFKGRIWRSTSTSSKGSYSSSADINKFSTSNIHPVCNQYNGYKLHYINPYVGKFVHLDDIGDLVYISWHHDNNQLICARTADLGGTWRYNYSTIEGAWGQRTRDAGYHVSDSGEHTDGGVTSAVYLGQGVLVAAFGGAYPHSGRGVAENSNSQALLVRSFDYGKNWHMIGDEDLSFTFSNLNAIAGYASHFNVGRYYDVMSNKFRLICFAGSGGTTGQGNYGADGFGWTIGTNAFALAYSDDFGDTWNWSQIDGTEINFNLSDGTTWPDNSNFRGDSMHFCDQQSKVYIVRTHFQKALESNVHGVTRQNWSERNMAWTYISSDGGRTFESSVPGYLDNLYNQDAGIVTENGVYNKGGGDLNKTGRPTQESLLGKSYRNVMKVEPYGTDGVAVFWQRNSDQEYQVVGYADGSSQDNNAIEVVNYKNLSIPTQIISFQDWALTPTDINQLHYSYGGTLSAYEHLFRAIDIDDSGTRMVISAPSSRTANQTDDAYGIIWVYHLENGQWVEKFSTGETGYDHNVEPVSSGTHFKREYRFGFDVALSGDGNTLAVGAPGHMKNGTFYNSQTSTYDLEWWNTGAIYIYKYISGQWSLHDMYAEKNIWEHRNLGEILDINYDGRRIISATADMFSDMTSIYTEQIWRHTTFGPQYWPSSTRTSTLLTSTSFGGQYTAFSSTLPDTNTDLYSHTSFSEDFLWATTGSLKNDQAYNGSFVHIGRRKINSSDGLRKDHYDRLSSRMFFETGNYIARLDQYYSLEDTPPGVDKAYLKGIIETHLNNGASEFSARITHGMPCSINESDVDWKLDQTTGVHLKSIRFGVSAKILDNNAEFLLVGAPSYRMRSVGWEFQAATPARLYDSNLEHEVVGAVYLLKWNPAYLGPVVSTTQWNGDIDVSQQVGRWESVFSDGGPLILGKKDQPWFTEDYPGDPSTTAGEHPLRDWRNDDNFGWNFSFDGVSNQHGQYIVAAVPGDKVYFYKYNSTDNVELISTINGDGGSNLGGTQHLYAGRLDSVKLSLDAKRIFVKAHVQDDKPLSQGYNINSANVGVFNTNLAVYDTPTQPEHRMTLISDIMNPSSVRNSGNVIDYFMNPYHYSWATNNTYKRLFNEGSHLHGCSLPNGDLAFIQGGYGNLNYGNGILAYAKKFDPTWIGFSGGEQYVHTMAGSFVGYDGWRDLSSGKASNNNYIFQSGAAMYPNLNDIGGPSTTRSWGDYNGSTRYYGYWIEKEVNIDSDNGTVYLARDSADGKPCVDVAIPEINRFTTPTVCSEYTNLVNDPVTQIRDIRTHASGPGGVIITLSNGKVWTTGYNSLSQRGNSDYTNEHDLSTNLDYPTMVPHPNKVDGSLTWDKCLLAIAPYGTHDHYTSIMMRDSENKLWGWGHNTYGVIGLGNNNNNIAYPQKTILPEGVFPSVMGQFSTASNGPIGVMITTEGALYAAGYNGNNGIAEGEGCPDRYNIFIPIRNPIA